MEKSGLEIKVQIAQLNVFLLFWTNEKTSLVNKSVGFVCCLLFFFLQGSISNQRFPRLRFRSTKKYWVGQKVHLGFPVPA